MENLGDWGLKENCDQKESGHIFRYWWAAARLIDGICRDRQDGKFQVQFFRMARLRDIASAAVAVAFHTPLEWGDQGKRKGVLTAERKRNCGWPEYVPYGGVYCDIKEGDKIIYPRLDKNDLWLMTDYLLDIFEGQVRPRLSFIEVDTEMESKVSTEVNSSPGYFKRELKVRGITEEMKVVRKLVGPRVRKARAMAAQQAKDAYSGNTTLNKKFGRARKRAKSLEKGYCDLEEVKLVKKLFGPEALKYYKHCRAEEAELDAGEIDRLGFNEVIGENDTKAIGNEGKAIMIANVKAHVKSENIGPVAVDAAYIKSEDITDMDASQLVKVKGVTERPMTQGGSSQDNTKVKIEKDTGGDNKANGVRSQVKVLGTVWVPSGVNPDMGPLVKFSGEHFEKPLREREVLEKEPGVGYEVCIRPKGLKRIQNKDSGGNLDSQSGKVQIMDRTLAIQMENDSCSDMNPPGTINIVPRPMPEVRPRFKGAKKVVVALEAKAAIESSMSVDMLRKASLKSLQDNPIKILTKCPACRRVLLLNTGKGAIRKDNGKQGKSPSGKPM